jgi:hypothetical protein
MIKKLWPCLIVFAFIIHNANSQVIINEGSNRNYLMIADENGEYPDWIELYNAGSESVSLYNYSLTDDNAEPGKWKFPNVGLEPGEFRVVFCSGKDRRPVSGFVNVVNAVTYNPYVGWNSHLFSSSFFWDGISNILINTCSYSSTGYTVNSVFNQTATSYWSTSFAAQDGNDGACYITYGSRAQQRPNMKLNNKIVGTGQIQNSPYDYPAPYGNWYWSARHQMLITAQELSEAGLNAGFITSLAFDVVSTDPNTVYDYINISMKLVSYDEVPAMFDPVDASNFLHTNFKISGSGETIYLYSPDQVLVSELFVNCNDLDNSRGRLPDGSENIYLFQYSTPSASNNNSNPYTDYLLAPELSIPSGFYDEPVSISIANPNTEPSSVHYTLDGSDPTVESPVYTGDPMTVSSSSVLKARVFSEDILPSPIVAASYFFGVSHSTPIISLITDNSNLYGDSGIFDNWWNDWERAAYVEYFDSLQNLVFSQRTGIQIDGGWGGARYQPQHSFRCELDDGVLGDGHIDYQLIPGRPDRTRYSRFYLRNGSNQYLVLPYKDACEVTAMGSGTNNYYSAWRPVSVYINGSYFGLYELREKIDAEYFETLEGADVDQMDLLSLSAWYSYVLRAQEGSADSFFEDHQAFDQLDPSDTNYWEMADQYFDLNYYTDYIIGESWIANTDWPYNNIRIYRSDKTDFRWRFCLIDLELSLQPNSWTDCYFDHIQFMLGYDPNNPYINIWLKSIQNERYRNYFINRFADVMNTAYLFEHISSIENNMFGQTVIEMPDEFDRWGDPNNIFEQMVNFVSNHQTLVSQFSARTEQVRSHIQSNFGLSNQVDLTLNVFPEGAGKIHISTITPGSYPWQGVYFNGVPVKIEAVPEEGYAFHHWGSNELISDTLNPVFLDHLNANSIDFIAYFEEFATGIPVTEDNTGISVYPNPARDILFIENDNKTEDLQFQVVDVNGRIILKGELKGGPSLNEIDISSIPVSVYLLRINNFSSKERLIRFVKAGE